MKQSRKASLIESIANVTIGFGVGVVSNLLVLPLFGFHPSLFDATSMSLWFTVISVVRSFTLRRSFEALRVGGWLI